MACTESLARISQPEDRCLPLGPRRADASGWLFRVARLDQVCEEVDAVFPKKGATLELPLSDPK